MTDNLRAQYCDVWRDILCKVAEWDTVNIDAFIVRMFQGLEAHDSIIFHELPSTWVGWALFPLSHDDDLKMSDAKKRAQNEFFELAHSLHGGNEFQSGIEWESIRPAYRQLVTNIDELHKAKRIDQQP